MSNGTVRDDGRYWAFISYSHKDAAFGRRLHRRLEAYALPRRLVGRAAGEGSVVPRRLTPIFRDREEFPAAQDLSAEVRAALRESRSLIVVCSPAAAASPWVAREVELFRELHPGRPVFAAIREGDPKDSLPPVLRLIGADGRALEPLAADFRRGHDGWELGLLKLVAGMLGVGLDELVQRDGQRRLQRVMAVTASALVLVLVMAVLTAFAISARQEAERQHREAEGLVGFMSTDVRERLRGVGRLDLMGAINERALQYYDSEIEPLSPAAIMQRARVLQAMGEVAEAAGDHDKARKTFVAAKRATHQLLLESPNDPERIFADAQSEYWLGFDDYEQNFLPQAMNHFLDYQRFAQRLVAFQPHNARYLRELAYAEGNLCSLALQPPRKPVVALKLCGDALVHMETAARGKPALNQIDADLANRQSWLGSAYRANRDSAHALEHWLVQEKILTGLMKIDPLNEEYREEWIGLQRLLTHADLEAGELDRARTRLDLASKLLDEMILFDPENKTWRRQRIKLDSDLSKFYEIQRGDKQ